MNKRTGILGLGVLLILVIGTFSFSAFAQNSELSVIESKGNSNSAKFVPGQLIVGLDKPDPNFNAKAFHHGGQVINSIEQINAVVVKVPLNTEEKFISAISKNPNVVYVERDVIMTATSQDLYYDIQWGLQHIGMDSVWDDPSIDPSLGTGIIVAVVDTGIYSGHSDFEGTTILTDLDYDFIDDDYNTEPTTICIDQYGIRAEFHGTFVAGIIAATKDNTIGIAGIGPFSVLPVRVLNQCGSGPSSVVADGIIHAALNGANVINLSLGGPYSEVIENAVDFARADPTDAVVIAASGNAGNTVVSYPAGLPTVISVGATTNTYERATYSQYGSTLELAAPGGSSGACSGSGTPTIVSTGVGVSGGTAFLTYQCGTGTSFAAPHAAGVAALIKAKNPDACNEEIRLHLQNTAEDLTDDGQERDDEFGYGLVRADIALATPVSPAYPCIDDTTPPVLSIPADTIVEDPASSDPPETGTATATDDYDPNPSVTFIDSSAPDANPQILEVITRTWTATDASNNSASEDQTITVNDTTPPVLSIPADTIVEDPASSDPPATGTATATDASDSNPSVTFSDSSAPDANPQILEVITRTWTATDASNNSTSEDQIITVMETTVTPPAVYVVDLDGSVNGKKNLNYEVTIKVNIPVEGITVEGYWSTNPLSLSTCDTNSSGECNVNYTTKVTEMSFEVSLISGNYEPSLNDDPDNDSDGTLITITNGGGGNGGGGNGGGGNGDDGGKGKPCNPKKETCPP